ncbi:Inclusion body clearance protein IML2 [Trichoderma simmonsii]|uniref:Inclusion body clearance protein IML2 n=1 Tax=Trichoderma simmonsii TaxID=1491479 RepID=A0A8G0LNF2_9HYPO|nr:Inclusion body clearance protein IML2 [Trichoderma simmonsii]
MSRLGGWFRSGGNSKNGSDTSLSPIDSIAKEKENLVEAMNWVELIMNDDIDGAWEKLQLGDSAFHEMGSSVAFFMRSVLGFEKQVMTEATARLNECENRAWADLKRAQKHGAAYNSSQLYPPGTEYELIIAETQLMGAVVGVLHESLVEAMRSFYKLRKAFLTLDAIVASEAKIFGKAATPGSSRMSLEGSSSTSTSTLDASSTESSASTLSSSDLEASADSSRSPSGQQTPSDQADPDSTAQQLEKLNLGKLEDTSKLSLRSKDSDVSSDVELDNPVDKFIHSGANMCFGVLLLILSLIPPAFSRILSIVGFHGDRSRAVKMLWKSAAHSNINGAVAGMMLLAYYNGLLGAADILPAQQDYDADAEAVGPPIEKCEKLLAEMRARYPDSRLWRVDEARMLANERKLTEALDLLKTGKESKMKQVAALNNFELSLNCMFSYDWELMRSSFLKCLEVNDWSPSMYYYMAGCASLELYRNAVNSGDKDEARRQKNKTEEYYRKAPTVIGKKRLMARQLPLETFLQRKIQKWEDRAKALGIDLADAIGSSPALEMCYVWNGQKRMGTEQLEKGLDYLDWERCTASKEDVAKIQAEKDEMAVWAVSRASLLRGAEKLDEARALLNEKVVDLDRSVFKGASKDDYVLPAAIYELGAIAWAECCNPPEGEEKEILEYRRKKMLECEEQINKVKVWEAYTLDARIGMRATSGLETLAWFKKKYGW